MALLGVLARVGRVVAPVASKLIGKAARWVTKGKLIGQGGGRAAAGRAVQAAGAIAGTAVVSRATDAVLTRRASQQTGLPPMSQRGSVDFSGEMAGSGKRYRRMNPLNARALRRAVRRLEGAEKLFKKVFRFNHGKAASNVRPKIGGR